MTENRAPYIVTKKVVEVEEKKHNPDYDQEALCECGHPYYRHFDTYEDMAPVGCKYCYSCNEFQPMSADTLRDIMYLVHNVIMGHAELEGITKHGQNFKDCKDKIFDLVRAALDAHKKSLQPKSLSDEMKDILDDFHKRVDQDKEKDPFWPKPDRDRWILCEQLPQPDPLKVVGPGYWPRKKV